MYLLKYESDNVTFIMDLDSVDLGIVEKNKTILLTIRLKEKSISFDVDSCSLYCNGNLILHKTIEDFK